MKRYLLLLVLLGLNKPVLSADSWWEKCVDAASIVGPKIASFGHKMWEHREIWATLGAFKLYGWLNGGNKPISKAKFIQIINEEKARHDKEIAEVNKNFTDLQSIAKSTQQELSMLKIRVDSISRQPKESLDKTDLLQLQTDIATLQKSVAIMDKSISQNKKDIGENHHHSLKVETGLNQLRQLIDQNTDVIGKMWNKLPGNPGLIKPEFSEEIATRFGMMNEEMQANNNYAQKVMITKENGEINILIKT